jgi:predicted membrane protein
VIWVLSLELHRFFFSCDENVFLSASLFFSLLAYIYIYIFLVVMKMFSCLLCFFFITRLYMYMIFFFFFKPLFLSFNAYIVIKGRGRLTKRTNSSQNNTNETSKREENDQFESCVGTLAFMPPEAFDDFRGVSPMKSEPRSQSGPTTKKKMTSSKVVWGL